MSAVRRDQIIVSLAALVWIGGTLIGTGLVGGGGVAEQGDGLFSDSATLIAPAGPAFSIWSVIHAFLAGYVIWQWLPGSAETLWATRTRLPAAASLALNGVWLLVVFAGWVLVSVLVIAGIAVSLGIILDRTAGLRDEGWGPRIFVSMTFGLYLGWICVATCANVAVWLVSLGVPTEGLGATIATIAVLLVVVGLAGLLLTRTTDHALRAVFAAALVWGVSWTAAGRLTGELRHEVVGYAAVATAVVVIATWAALTRRTALGRP